MNIWVTTIKHFYLRGEQTWIYNLLRESSVYYNIYANIYPNQKNKVPQFMVQGRFAQTRILKII